MTLVSANNKIFENQNEFNPVLSEEVYPKKRKIEVNQLEEESRKEDIEEDEDAVVIEDDGDIDDDIEEVEKKS